MPPRWVISYVAQETPAVDRAALDHVMDGDVEFREIESAMAHAQGEELAHLHARYDEIGGYQARSRAQTLLAGLGFQALATSSAASGSPTWRRAKACNGPL